MKILSHLSKEVLLSPCEISNDTIIYLKQEASGKWRVFCIQKVSISVLETEKVVENEQVRIFWDSQIQIDNYS